MKSLLKGGLYTEVVSALSHLISLGHNYYVVFRRWPLIKDFTLAFICIKFWPFPFSISISGFCFRCFQLPVYLCTFSWHWLNYLSNQKYILTKNGKLSCKIMMIYNRTILSMSQARTMNVQCELGIRAKCVPENLFA